MTDIRTVITRRLESLEAEETELKRRNEMLHDALANDPELCQLEEDAKEAKKRYQACKEAILNEPENRKVMDGLKEVKQGIKELQELLSSDLLGYFHETGGKLQIRTENGKVYNIKFKGKTEPADGEQTSLIDAIQDLNAQGVTVEIAGSVPPGEEAR